MTQKPETMKFTLQIYNSAVGFLNLCYSVKIIGATTVATGAT